MTNSQKWMAITDNLSCPENYLQWSWRFVVGAALQRRVWIGYDIYKIFPNLYMIYVGGASVGKTMSMRPALELLRFHKLKDFSFVTDNMSAEERIIAEAVMSENKIDANDSELQAKKGGEKIEPCLFTGAPDAITFEQFISEIVESTRRINTKEYDEKTESYKTGIYTHSSLYFCLSELGYLIRKRTEDLVNVILGLYDSPDDYQYKTKASGKFRVRKCCISILAAATPEFIEEVLDDQTVAQGLSARFFFIFASKNRKNVLFPDPMTEEQKMYKKDLLLHIKNLARLYGQVKIEPATIEWLKNWWNDYENNRQNRSNKSPKLERYYGRKNLHMFKVAMVEHFSESLDLTIPLETFQRAIKILDEEEKTMHEAMVFSSKNSLANVTDSVVKYLRTKGNADFVDLLSTFWRELPNGKDSMTDILEYLMNTGTVIQAEEKTAGGSVKIVYVLKQ